MKLKISMSSIILIAILISTGTLTVIDKSNVNIKSVETESNTLTNLFNENYDKFQIIMEYLLKKNIAKGANSFYLDDNGKVFYSYYTERKNEIEEITDKKLKESITYLVKEYKFYISKYSQDIGFSSNKIKGYTISYFYKEKKQVFPEERCLKENWYIYRVLGD